NLWRNNIILITLSKLTNLSNYMHFKFKTKLLAGMLLCFAFVAQAQQKKDITLEDIYQKGTFRAQSVYGVNWMNDGQYYSSQVPDEKNKVTDIVKYNVTTGQPVSTIIEGEDLKS